MTDLELTKACAEAMGYTVNTNRISRAVANTLGVWTNEHGHYYPLFSDVQAMAMVKKFRLCIHYEDGLDMWCSDGTVAANNLQEPVVYNADLNRAICECVAKIKE